MSKKFKYKFSVITPVFNVEDYLDDLIDSILNQSIGFIENCELIFVDDGSTDNSHSICKEFVDKYPENIKLIKQENLGPGAARNAGVDIARGEYISMPDSDDKLSLDTLENVYSFFKKHHDEIDIITIPWEFFEARSGRDHPLNHKFTVDRVIDLSEEWSSVVGSAAPSFFKASVFESHRFDPYVGRYSEDLRFMGEVLLDKKKYGALCGSTYFYRKRKSKTSSQDGNTRDLFWYLETPKRALLDLLEYSLEQEGSIPKFIQFMVAYDIQWRTRVSLDALESDQEEEYLSIIGQILSNVDYEVVGALKNANLAQKMRLLDLSGRSFRGRMSLNEDGYYVFGKLFSEVRSIEGSLKIEIVEINKDELIIEGLFSQPLEGDMALMAKINNKNHKSVKIRRIHSESFIMGGSVAGSQTGFSVKIPKEDLRGRLEFKIEPHNTSIKIDTSFLSRIGGKKYSYRTVEGYLIERRGDYSLNIARCSKVRHLYKEVVFILRAIAYIDTTGIPRPIKLKNYIHSRIQGTLGRVIFAFLWVVLLPIMFIKDSIKSGLKGSIDTYVKPLISNIKKNLFTTSIRTAAHLGRLFYKRKRQVWLVLDRTSEADDSGEFLFEHILKQDAHLGKITKFAISSTSKDYERLKVKFGDYLLDTSSIRYKIMFLMTDKLISSEATGEIMNPFGDVVDGFVDMYIYKFVFLQHGVIKDDISSWLNKYNKNISLFITSTEKEKQSIISGNYHYGEDVVKLTGLARYDKLNNEPKKKIIVMPTWRSNIAANIDPSTGIRSYKNSFRDTEFYKFYSSLINSETLVNAMKEFGVRGEFYLHPSFRQQANDFEENEVFKVMTMPYDYSLAKSEGSLMVTDYSSVAFDFAYLGKPVVYSQFDRVSFYKLHTSSEGYFDYKKDGFGPVVEDLDSSVQEITSFINSDFSNPRKYKKRASDFFEFMDKNNSERILKEISNL